ncbi:MAG: hypothetical protein O3A13_00385 [Proteobacteria bacterium]|nr:hypothetical protein [Pseudomonadota bacterium]MDA0992069.1 hypothetical protein [Pseudomonadota bacterium]
MTAISGDAAEYSEADDIPAVTSLVFTEGSIALTVVRDSSGYLGANRTSYFLADRESYSFQEISEQKFHSLTLEEHVHESTRETTELGIDLSPTDDCNNKGYRYDGGDHDITGRRILQLPSTAIDVEMLCRSGVSSAVSIDGSIWIGTYTPGDHGNYGSEGVLVVPKNGDPVVHLDIARDIVNKLVVDPWSSNVWVVTHSQLFRVANDTAVLARYSAYREFDYDGQRPVVRVAASQTCVENNPLAVLADWLGPSSYRTLSEASKNGVKLPGAEPLYHYAMFGNHMSYQPQWPEELAGALEHPQPTFGWRKFACLLHGDKAKNLCATELGEWPRSTDSYLRILQDRFPGFVVTGPVYGPKGDENLRGNRYSPNNFSDDILFGDFDANGVRDFAAVLIEQGATFDPHLDKGPIGFVVVCNGQWSPESLGEYSCSDLTEREPGGFRAELDFVDWAPWANTLLDRSPQSGDRFCPYMLQTNPFNAQTKKGTKKLSIMSSFGHCDWFFYHMDGKYRGCQYCSD